ncbi:unnamed protein product, partial [Iphiclides podalirius]
MFAVSVRTLNPWIGHVSTSFIDPTLGESRSDGDGHLLLTPDTTAFYITRASPQASPTPEAQSLVASLTHSIKDSNSGVLAIIKPFFCVIKSKTWHRYEPAMTNDFGRRRRDRSHGYARRGGTWTPLVYIRSR